MANCCTVVCVFTDLLTVVSMEKQKSNQPLMLKEESR